jgi:hypothetical protein
MTTALLDPPDTADAVPAGLARIHRALDQLQAGPAEASQPGVAVAEVGRAIHRLEAYQLRLVAAADKSGVAADAGFTDTGAWVARQTTRSRTKAARDVALATQLESGHAATADALDQGLLSPSHASVILRAGEELPEGVSAAQRQHVEATLVEKAQHYDPDQLRRIARRAIEAVEPDQAAIDAHENQLVRSAEQIARDKTGLTLHDNHDGTVTGHFIVPVLAASILRKVIESITAPRRMRGSAGHRDGREATGSAPAPTSSPSPSPSPSAEPSDRLHDWTHRRGLAFAELLEHLPTEHLHPKTAATVVVTIDHEILRGALRAAHLDTDDTISAGEARRLACNAGIIPAVLGTRSVALDLGFENRLFSEAQRLAKGLQHLTCGADGCDRPYAWCELHHKNPWSQGGRTDLADATPLCHRHHQWVHDTTYNHHYLPDGTLRFSRRA